jgi:hypothetical protein
MILDEATRLREEDPYTGLLAARLPSSIVVRRSRFEAAAGAKLRPQESAATVQAKLLELERRHAPRLLW